VVKFVWRQDDWWYSEFASMAQDVASNQGAVPFYVDCVLDKPSDLSDIKNSLPRKMLRFMEEGRKIEHRYRNIFPDEQRLKKALFKTKYLIDIL
jgi:hypothetical protein